MSNTKSESAFPQIETGTTYDGDYNGDVFSTGGLTKREYFAIRIVAGMSANGWFGSSEESIIHAVKAADALIAELNK